MISKRLRLSFQPFLPGLLADLDGFTHEEWTPHHPSSRDPLLWRVLPLRSRGGDATDWSPRGINQPGEPYADTPLLARCPSAKELLGRFQCELNSVRFSAVPAGGSITRHTDSDSSGLIIGSQLRLHIPVRTHPGVHFEIGGERQHWAPGELWWGDFTLPHEVKNPTGVFRVHLLLCAVANEWLLSLFDAGEPQSEQASGSSADLR